MDSLKANLQASRSISSDELLRDRWLEYSDSNRRDQKMAKLWIQPLTAWVLSPRPQGLSLTTGARVLDFGCGYLDAGLALKERASVVDGLDIDPYACDLAELRLKNSGVQGKIYQSLDELPQGVYDLVILNSVMQYFKDHQTALSHLQLLAKTLKSEGVIIISDLIPNKYSRYLDGLFGLYYGLMNGAFLPMVRHLWFAATKKTDLKLLTYDPEQILELAKVAGLTGELLAKNLTPSPYRYSLVASKRTC